ncbi:MAG TPA: hypothetical protein PKW06_10655 [Cyclobacteriaceae bacterium]|nr:hypothetical protein [Cyclobacteriaceae bacterium]MCB9238848.1 hypothetical protein [Flammeovirgaceae bacterium]MCB0498124.1 hypothetical protein [Cyclobacteriaceae bacterium]MCO5270567.1 hypothetical protein [Cyclobacteriaceae bacterium]MCW5900992.1 hypothetical protein [Cyclobacteriaceae bacterium]
MKHTFPILLLLGSFGALAQTQAAEALAKDAKTLNERYAVMKDKSETFNEYKVIKEYILDGMWKLTTDSIKKVHRDLAEARAGAAQLQMKLDGALAAVKAKENSMEEVEHAATHISVLGMDFGKGFFIGLVGFVLLGMVVLMGLVGGRLKMVYQSLREKIEMEDLINKEFENYKRKALDKQMKLSRELQNERNKMAEMRSA